MFSPTSCLMSRWMHIQIMDLLPVVPNTQSSGVMPQLQLTKVKVAFKMAAGGNVGDKFCRKVVIF